MEKKGPFYKVYMDSNVENFCRKKYTDKMTRGAALCRPGQNSGGKKGESYGKGGEVMLYFTMTICRIS